MNEIILEKVFDMMVQTNRACGAYIRKQEKSLQGLCHWLSFVTHAQQQVNSMRLKSGQASRYLEVISEPSIISPCCSRSHLPFLWSRNLDARNVDYKEGGPHEH